MDKSQTKFAFYEWSKLLTFSRSGDATPYLGPGWGEPEAGQTWTDGINASLQMRVTPPASDVALVLSCTPFLAEGKIPHQELTVFVNFLRVGCVLVGGPREIEVNIPKWVFKETQLHIDFYLPNAASPKTLGIGSDARRLGLAVNRMMMTLI